MANCPVPEPDDRRRIGRPPGDTDETTRQLFVAHDRRFETARYVYPVISRRSRGLSIGVNLSPGKVCNYRCVYCQVDRTTPAVDEPIDTDVLREELEATVALAADGRLFKHPWFVATPERLRRFNDIAFSGDGEPTLCPRFAEAVAVAADVRRRLAPPSVKLVLITNATLLDQPRVCRGLDLLDANHGEIWAKLEAGTQHYHEQVLRSNVPLDRILANLLHAARRRPIVIQTLFLRLRGQGPDQAEIAMYIQRLQDLLRGGGQIRSVHIHTVVRAPAEAWAQPLPDAVLDDISQRVREATGLSVETFYG